jgi:hypothetical protein
MINAPAIGAPGSTFNDLDQALAKSPSGDFVMNINSPDLRIRREVW